MAKVTLAKSKKAKKPLTGMIQDKKTQFPSKLILTVQIPTKTQRQKADMDPYLMTHSGVLIVWGTDVHPK